MIRMQRPTGPLYWGHSTLINLWSEQLDEFVPTQGQGLAHQMLARPTIEWMSLFKNKSFTHGKDLATFVGYAYEQLFWCFYGRCQSQLDFIYLKEVVIDDEIRFSMPVTVHCDILPYPALGKIFDDGAQRIRILELAQCQPLRSEPFMQWVEESPHDESTRWWSDDSRILTESNMSNLFREKEHFDVDDILKKMDEKAGK